MPTWSMANPSKSWHSVCLISRVEVRFSVSGKQVTKCAMYSIPDGTIHSTNVRFHLLTNACKQHLKGHRRLAFPLYFRCPEHILSSSVKSSPGSVLAAAGFCFTSAVARWELLGLASCSSVLSVFCCNEESVYFFMDTPIQQWKTDAIGKVLS